VTTIGIVLACMALMLAIGMVRDKPGRAVADIAILVMLFGIITIVDLLFGWFVDTGNTANIVAIFFAAGFTLDSVYGLLAPERQKQRDKKLRRLMKRRA
jgi:hypothetical protein